MEEDGPQDRAQSNSTGLDHFAERAQFLDRLRQTPRPQRHLALEVRIGFLQAASHLVELIGERFELVAGTDRNALAEIAAADPRRAGREHPDRPDHAPRQQQPGEKTLGSQPPRAAPRPSARLKLYRAAHRSFGDRQLDEQEPAERERSAHRAVNTSRPRVCRCASCTFGWAPSLAFSASCRAALTCASCDMSVLRSTRLLSGCAISRPSRSTT